MLAIALFAIIATATVSVFIYATSASKQGVNFIVASSLIAEGVQAVRSIHDQDAKAMISGTYGLSTTEGKYTLTSSKPAINEIYTRTIEISDVYREGDLLGSIVNGGVYDPGAKKATVTLSWTALNGLTRTLDHVVYLYSFGDLFWSQSTKEDFTEGEVGGSRVQESETGEVAPRARQEDFSGMEAITNINLEGNGDVVAFAMDSAADMLYIATENSGGAELTGYSVANASNAAPVRIKEINLDGKNITDLEIASGIAYVSCEANDAELISINLSTGEIIHQEDIPGDESMQALAINGNNLVATRSSASEEKEVVFYTIDGTGSMTRRGLTSGEVSAGAIDVALTSTHAFIASAASSQELIVFDLSSTGEVARVDVPGEASAEAIITNGTALFIGKQNAAEASDMFKYSIADPATPTLSAEIDTGTHVRAIAINPAGDALFTTGGSDDKEMTVIAASDLSITDQITLDQEAGGTAITHHAGLIYTGSNLESNEVAIARSSEGGWSEPTLAAILATGTIASQVDGNTAYSITSDTLYIHDITDPEAPDQTAELPLTAPKDAWLNAGHLYLATGDEDAELQIINVQDISSPCLAATLNADGDQAGAAITGSSSHVFLAREKGADAEIIAADISPQACEDVAELSPAWQAESSNNINDIAFAGSNLYAVTSQDKEELITYDISNPEAVEETIMNFSGDADALSITASNNILIVGREVSSDKELYIMDASAGVPETKSSMDFAGDVRDASFFSQTAIAVAASAEFLHINITNQTNPTITGKTASAATSISSSSTVAIVDGFTMTEASTPNAASENATFTSQVFDSASPNTEWKTIDWTLSATDTITFRVRTASSEELITSAPWSDPITASGSSITLHDDTEGTKFFQWKAYFTGTDATIDDVRVSYSL